MTGGVWGDVDTGIVDSYETVADAVDAYTDAVYPSGEQERSGPAELAGLYADHLADAIDMYEEQRSTVTDDAADVLDIMAVLETNRLLRKTVQDNFLERTVMSYLGNADDADTLLADVELQEGSFITPADLPDIYRAIVSRTESDTEMGAAPVTAYDRLNATQEELIERLQKHASNGVASEKEIMRAAPIYDGYILPDINIGPDNWSPRPRTESPLSNVHAGLEGLDPNPEDVIYDLGSGYGYFVLYGALMTDATYRGVEIDDEIATAAEGMRERFGLDNATFHNTDVREYDDLAEGDVFYLFNPFPRDVLEQVGDRLAGVAEKKPITIVSLGMSTWYFDEQEWLEPASAEDAATSLAESRIEIFDSV